jgi:hypothetical protein
MNDEKKDWDSFFEIVRELNSDSSGDEYDEINHPSHYTTGNIETIDYIVDIMGPWYAAHYCWGTVHKYLGSRMFNKDDPLKNALKAHWFLEKHIELLEECKGVNW